MKINTLTASEWVELKTIIQVLNPIFVTMKKLQHAQLTLSEFYGIWVNLRLSLSKIQNQHTIAKEFYVAIQSRERVLLTNPVVLASLCLHPQYKVLLRGEEMQLGIQVLLQLWERMKNIEKRNEVDGSTNSAQDKSNNEDSELDLLLLEKQQDFVTNIDDITISNDERIQPVPLDLRLLITTFIKTVFTNNKLPILKFWENNKTRFSELYMLANVVNAIPATQVRVERDFSALSNLFGKLRTNLSDENLEHILLVKLNPQLF